MEQIIRRPIKFGEKRILDDFPDRRKNIFDDNFTIRPTVIKDFVIEEIDCIGSLELIPYDIYIPRNYPARMLCESLNPAQSKKLWNDEQRIKLNSIASIWLKLGINRDMWESLCEQIGRENPLICLLDIPRLSNSRMQQYGVTTHPIERDDEGNLSIHAYTWRFVEESEATHISRWQEAMGEDCPHFAEILGEVLLTPNFAPIYNQIGMQIIPFGGKY